MGAKTFLASFYECFNTFFFLFQIAEIRGFYSLWSFIILFQHHVAVMSNFFIAFIKFSFGDIMNIRLGEPLLREFKILLIYLIRSF